MSWTYATSFSTFHEQFVVVLYDKETGEIKVHRLDMETEEEEEEKCQK